MFDFEVKMYNFIMKVFKMFLKKMEVAKKFREEIKLVCDLFICPSFLELHIINNTYVYDQKVFLSHQILIKDSELTLYSL